MIYFDAKLPFTYLASLRSAIFSETQVDNLLVTFPARVKYNLQSQDHRHRAPFANLENILGESACSKDYMLKTLIIPFGIIYVISFSMLIFATANLVYYIMKYRSRLQSLGNTADTRGKNSSQASLRQFSSDEKEVSRHSTSDNHRRIYFRRHSMDYSGYCMGKKVLLLSRLSINQGRFVGWRKGITNGQGFEEKQLDDLCRNYRILHFTHIAAYSGNKNQTRYSYPSC